MPDKSVYRDVYNIHSECLKRLNEPDFWDRVFWPMVKPLAAKHQDDVFFAEMLATVFCEIERRWKRGSVQLASGQE